MLARKPFGVIIFLLIIQMSMRHQKRTNVQNTSQIPFRTETIGKPFMVLILGTTLFQENIFLSRKLMIVHFL